jgi:hypothetical protein
MNMYIIIVQQGTERIKRSEILYQKITKESWGYDSRGRGMTQVVGLLPSKHETLNSKPSSAPTKKERKLHKS